MKKTYLFLLALIFAISTTGVTKAQTWDAPEPEGSDISGLSTCYVYNVGAKQFLDRGGEWSTQAIVSSGSLMKLVSSSSLWILEYNSNTQTLFPADVADGWTFSDGTGSNTWDIQSVDITNKVYSIQVNNTYGGYNAAQYLGAAATAYNSNRGLVYDVRYNRVASDYTKWKFCTAAAYEKFNAQVKLDKLMKIAKLVGSSVDLTSYITTYNTGTPAEIITAIANLNTALAPVDKTSSVTNPNFDTNAAGWTAAVTPSWGSNEIEYWQKNFDLNQTITGLPAGIYVVKVQGFERPVDASSASRTAYLNGWDVLNTKFYATASGTKIFQPLKNYFAETASPVGTSVDGLKFPNSMADAQRAFATGLYDNELSYVVVDATGSLTLGVSNVYDNNKAGRWVIMDNFRLYYYGALAIPNLTVSQSSMFITNVVTTTNTFDVTGANLTSDIAINAPAGITLSGANLVDNGGGSYSIALVNAGSLNTITVAWDEAASLSGLITIQSTGANSKEIIISTSKDAGCFTPLYNDRTNLVADPYCNDRSKFGGWGNVEVSNTTALCGLRSLKVFGGSLDVSVAGGAAIASNKTYRVKTNIFVPAGHTAKFGLFLIGNSGDVNIYNSMVNDAWETVDFTFKTATVGAGGVFFQRATGADGVYVDNYEMYEVAEPTIRIKYVDADNETITLKDDRVHTSTWGATVANYLMIGKTFTAPASDKEDITFGSNEYNYEATSVDNVTVNEGENIVVLKFKKNLSTSLDNGVNTAISVYPTVASGKVTVDMKSQNGVVRVFDATGKMIHSRNISGSVENFEVSGSGLFMFEIRTEKSTEMVKVINLK